MFAHVSRQVSSWSAYAFYLFALGLVGSVAGGWIADRIGPNRPEAYGVIPGLTLLLTVPFFLGGLMVRDGGMSLIFFAIPLLLSYAWIGPGLAATQTLTPPASRAAVAAIIGFFNNLIGIGLGPLAVGALSDFLRQSHSEGEALRLALMAGWSRTRRGFRAFHHQSKKLT